MTSRFEVPITAVTARAYVIPTDGREADGTLEWSATTLVTIEVEAGGARGLGYTYGAAAAAHVVEEMLAPLLLDADAFATPKLWDAMVRSVRNVGRPGIASAAISAADAALWDLKARLLGVPLAVLLGWRRRRVAVYGSGGFTSYDERRLAEQLSGWVEEIGCRAVKIKIGGDPARDIERVQVARGVIGDAELMVDANGAYDRRKALALAERLAELDVTWLEEPVSSDDIAGLKLLRERMPAAMELAAGEYVYDAYDARRLVETGAVDVLQIDATRCGGLTGFLQAAAIAACHHVSVSAHTAPSLHLALACAVPRFRHVEWFHDHVRIEQRLFDGAPVPKDGWLSPDFSAPGHGLELKRREAERFLA